MSSASLVSIDWGAVALLTLIAAGLVWGLLFFLRQNRKDLDTLEETLESDREDNEK